MKAVSFSVGKVFPIALIWANGLAGLLGNSGLPIGSRLAHCQSATPSGGLSIQD
jgi:hypothetical protein